MNKSTFLLLLLFTVVAPGLSATESPAPMDAIQRMLSDFAGEWTTPDPPKSPCHISNVLKLIDLNYEGLEKVREAAAKGDMARADAELLNYFKRTRGASPTKPPKAETLKVADQALLHLFRGNRNTHPPIFRGVEVDWRSKAVHEGETIHDAEWLFQYHRLTWWPALAAAYGKTGNEQYFFEWRYELARYMETNLPITRETPWFIRRGMESYGRCQVATRVLPNFIQSPEFDAKLLRWFLVSFHQQAEHIRTVYARKGNHLVGELNAVFKNGLAYPEFKKSQEWINEALDRFPKLMFSEMYEDGMNKELIFSYHGMYIGLFADFYYLAQAHGYEQHLPDEYMNRLRKACDVAMYHMFPDWTMSQFGDAWKGKPGNNWLFRAHACKLFPDVEYYRFMRARGKEGAPPPQTSMAYPQSGFYTFRSDWTKDAVYMSIKCGAKGEFHNQFDNGTFELYALGRNFMVDSGCYLYGSSSEKDQADRAWFRSTRVHQTLTMDNKNAARNPRFLFRSATPGLTTLSFENESYPELKHRRTVLFIDNRYFVIYDEAIGNATGVLRTHYQFAPCEYVLSASAMTAETRFDNGANLLVRSFPQHEELTMVQDDGWISYKQRQKQERPAWSYELKKTSSMPQAAFVTVLAPFENGPAPKITAAIVRNGQSADCRISIDQRRYKVHVDWGNGSSSLVD